MMILRWSPNSELRSSNPANTDSQEKDNVSYNCWSPKTDIYDAKDDYVLKMEIPGLSKKEVKIEIENDTLAVFGERKREAEMKEEYYSWTERRNGKFYRAFRLPEDIDAKKINASMKDGVLELRVPKPEIKKPKNIPITVH
jgi:HSP20 family protein